MGTPLCVLLVEDSEGDAGLILRELQDSGYDPEIERVCTPEGFSTALAEQSWDVIIADYRLPSFDGLDALAMVKGNELDLPFIIVSGVIGEDVAVASIKSGAYDYVMKDDLTRLGPAIRRALREAEDRRARRSAEEALRESEERYRRLVEILPDGVIVHSEGKVVLVNTAAAELLGAASPEQGIGLPVMGFVHPDYREIAIQRIQQALNKGRQVPPIEEKFIRLDGRPIDVEVAATAFTYRGKPAMLTTFRDIAERKKAEEVLRQYAAKLESRNEELDAFAHTVAHDLQNPLALVVGFAEALRRDYAKMPDEELQHSLQSISNAASRASNIVDELLLLAGLRQTEVEVEPLDMADVVGRALQRLTGMIEEYQVQITLPETWPVAMGHSPWVEEVWANYLSNAIKHGGRPPHVELGAAAQPDGAMRFWVRDNGPGLTPEEQARLFTPFTRLSQVHARGHGLGLSIVQRIVEKLGGQVEVESEEGRGSIFSFTLPSVPDAWRKMDE